MTGRTSRRRYKGVICRRSRKPSNSRSALVTLVALNSCGARNMARRVHHHPSASACVALDAITYGGGVVLEDRRTPRDAG